MKIPNQTQILVIHAIAKQIERDADFQGQLDIANLAHAIESCLLDDPICQRTTDSIDVNEQAQQEAKQRMEKAIEEAKKLSSMSESTDLQTN